MPDAYYRTPASECKLSRRLSASIEFRGTFLRLFRDFERLSREPELFVHGQINCHRGASTLPPLFSPGLYGFPSMNKHRRFAARLGRYLINPKIGPLHEEFNYDVLSLT